MAQTDISSEQEIEDLIKARYIIIYLVSYEEERVEQILQEIGKRRKRKVVAWSITEGFNILSDMSQGDKGESYSDIKDPMRALEFISKSEDNALFILRDYHPFLSDPTIVRRLRDLSNDFKKGKYFRHVIILSPIYKAPMELEKDMAVIDFELPGRKDLDKILNKCLRSAPNKAQISLREDPLIRERVVEAALGLTATEAENVFAKSLVRTHDFDIDTIMSEKKHIIRKSGLLEFYQATQTFDDIGGLEILKEWLRKRQLAFSSQAREFGLPEPKGILLIGVPGCGKSLTAKAVGQMWQMPLLRLDVGKVFASLVGSSEENMRRAIKTAEAVAPSILWLDELEKGFSGMQSSGMTDGGTTARVFSSFITWLQEKTSPVFVVATANDVTLLPPELLRKGRFDEIFFVDLPSPEERAEICKIHLRKKKRDASKFDVDRVVSETQNYSGSEIEQIIVSALYDAFEDKVDIDTERLLRSCTEIIPLAYTMKEKIDAMREWAKSRARKASLDTSDRAERSDIRQLEF